MTFVVFPRNLSHEIGTVSFRNLIALNLIPTFVSPVTQFPEKPLADDDPVANPFMTDPFENSISDLLYVITDALRNLGRYSYAFWILPIISMAVWSLFAQIMIFLSGKNVAYHRQKMV